MTTNTVLVSVADAILRDATTGAALLYGKSNITSSFAMTMTGTEIRGGYNNPLIYTFFHDKKIEIKITQAIFGEQILALNAGTLVSNTAVTVLATDGLTLSASGSATLTQTPTGNVSVIMPNGSIQFVTPVGSTITGVTGGANAVVSAVYPYSTTADSITVFTAQPPTVCDLTLICPVKDNTGATPYSLQINVPNFQVEGNYTMSFAANAANTQELDGVALSHSDPSGDYMARAVWIPSSTTTVPIYDIAANPTTETFSVAAGLPASKQITVYGLRGGLNTNIVVTTSCSFVKTSGSTCWSVGANTGLITAGSATLAGYLGSVTCTYYDSTSGSLTDVVSLVATA